MTDEITLNAKELKVLTCIADFYKDRELTPYGVKVLSQELRDKTWMTDNQLRTQKKRLDYKNLITMTFKELPRKLYFKLNLELVVPLLTANWYDCSHLAV